MFWSTYEKCSGYSNDHNNDSSQFKYLSQQGAQISGEVNPQSSTILIPAQKGSVQALDDFFADAQVPSVEHLILEGGQLSHHVLVLSEDVFGALFVANLNLIFEILKRLKFHDKNIFKNYH